MSQRFPKYFACMIYLAGAKSVLSVLADVVANSVCPGAKKLSVFEALLGSLSYNIIWHQ